jgi:Dimethlysulfonioproprionate lyase
MIGVSLMAPGLQYPDHQHPPAEVYYSLSPGSWRQGDRPWVTPGIGGLVYNPSNIVHSMRSSDGPLLAIWCLSL